MHSELPDDFETWDDNRKAEYVEEMLLGLEDLDLPPKRNAPPMRERALPKQRSQDSQPNFSERDQIKPKNKTIKGQPNTTEHVKSEKPDPDIVKSYTKAEKMRNRAEGTYLTEITTLNLLFIVFWLMKFIVSPALAVVDGAFSYWGLATYLDGKIIGLALAVAIGCIIFGLGVSTNIKYNGEVALARFIKLDTNDDEIVTALEKCVFGFKLISLGIIVAANVATNYLGMDAYLADGLFPVIPGWCTALFFSVVLMISPHFLMAIAEAMMDMIIDCMPEGIDKAGMQQAAHTLAVDVRKNVNRTVAGQGEAIAQQRAKDLIHQRKQPYNLGHKR